MPPGRPGPEGYSPRASEDSRTAATGVAAAAGVCERALGRGVTGSAMSDSMILPQVHLRKPCYDFSSF